MNESFEEKMNCSNCNEHITKEEVFCGSCGYPQNGTEDDKRSFALKVSSRKRLLKDANKKISNAKTVLYILAGLNAIVGIILFATADDYVSLVSCLIVAVIYLILVAWTDKQPFAAILTAFVIYLTIVLLSALDDPINLVSGFIWKILIIGAFVKGIKSGLEAKRLMEELKKFKVA